MSSEQKTVASPSIWRELETWSKGFDRWQRLLLGTAVRQGTVPPAVVTQAYALFLADHDLALEPDPPIEIPKSMTGKEPANVDRSQLRRIYSPSGINQLPSTSELTFGDGLTVIYGGNGVGKSGYARILSNACFSRQQHPIYPDVFDSTSPQAPSAKIELMVGDGNPLTLQFDGLTEHALLKRGFAVFDSAVAERHLTESSPIGFRPVGFDVFSEMARCYGLMQTMLHADIERRRVPNPFANVFVGPATSTSRIVSTLDATTDLDQLKTLASFGETEEARLTQLQRLTSDLVARSPEASIKRLNQVRPFLLALKDQLAAGRELLSDEMLSADARLVADHAIAAVELARIGTDQFNNPKLANIGSGAWSQLAASAVGYFGEQHEHYPNKDDVCVLCHQPLSDESIALLEKYRPYASGKARATFADLENRVSRRRASLEGLKLSLIENGTLLDAYLAEAQPALRAAVLELLTAMEDVRGTALQALSRAELSDSSHVLPDYSGAIDDAVVTLDSDLRLLMQSDVPAAIKAADDERAELRHRQVLAKNLDAVTSYVKDQRWATRAEQDARSALSTRGITEKEGELFGRVVADAYRTRLRAECEALSCAVPVELRTQGRQGQTVRSLQVQKMAPGDILSEGEQRAVALADFLTEVSLNVENVGIIFDDPVTSLDHERKEKIALRLAREAGTRQVIVLTHDLVFFGKICQAADEAGASIATHWMQRSADGRPGLVSQNDGPATTASYRAPTLAEQTLGRAKLAVGSAQEELVRYGANQLRRTIEEIVPELLLKKVVQRWEDRIMVTALKRIAWDHELIDEIIALFEECSAIMEGHSHTETRAEAPPTPHQLEELIRRTKDAIKRAKPDRK